ncbi:Plant regulator RWP-RK [Cynara cardunculus var. scolymus]|uniref:Plant regulator RWP-RK n=1 Tax=Cynara cardunculus var. scolymus TaxID=59895 RepID=A0A103YEH4_CYNCS|nr:Plant regulator RWP-RK [Cynara cardunculus var. scolymus]
MDPPATANPNHLHWFHHFDEENPPLPGDDQTMEQDHYMEMLDHQNYINYDQLGFQDFDPFEDLSLSDWCDDNGLPLFSCNHDRNDVITDVKPIVHDCNVTSGEANISSASAADHGGRKRERWDDDRSYVVTDVHRIDHDCHVTSIKDNSVTAAASDHGGRNLGWWELWDDSLPLLSCTDEIIKGGDFKPIDHDCHYVTSEAYNGRASASVGAADDGGGRPGRRWRSLELEEIEKLFEMPIVMAAKELNVGLTVLKKRCRELNIKRWPHRKLKSLKSLIQNVKEMGLTEEMEMVEENKRMMEKVPETELTERTKKLRQACFKFNYKKRRLVITN